MFAGVNYQRLEGYKTLHWPVAADGADEPLLYTKRFQTSPDGKARLFPLLWKEAPERPDAEFDLLLNNGRMLEHFHEGNLTYRSPGIKEKTPDTFVEVSPRIGRGGVVFKAEAWSNSHRAAASCKVRALVTDRVHNGELYMPMNSSEHPVNVLTGSHTDPVTHTPAYKETAVNLRCSPRRARARCRESIPASGIQRLNMASKVERKWKRGGL